MQKLLVILVITLLPVGLLLGQSEEKNCRLCSLFDADYLGRPQLQQI